MRPDNRIDPTTVASAATTPVSPTGQPIIPARWAPWLMMTSTLAGVPAALVGAGIALPAGVTVVASAISAIALILLGGSPGLRRRDHP